MMNGEPKKVLGNAASESGATAVEYGVMLALIAVAMMLAVTAVGTNMNTMYTYIAGLL